MLCSFFIDLKSKMACNLRYMIHKTTAKPKAMPAIEEDYIANY